MAQATARTTRARSKEIDSGPPSPAKKNARPRRGKSASVEPHGMDAAQHTSAQLNPHALSAVPEEPEYLISQLQNAANESNSQPFPDFAGADFEAIQSLQKTKGQKKPRGRQQAPAASAPTAIMTNDQAQSLAQSAQTANQQMAPLDPQLADAGNEQRRSMLDRQPNPVQLSFDDSQSQFPTILPHQQNLGEPAATQDNGFQSNLPSAAKSASKRRSKASRHAPHPSSDYQPQPPDEPEREPSPRATPPSSGYAQVQQQAKLFTAGLRRDKVPQKRKAWSSEECDALIDGIGQFGNAYASLKAEDQKHRGFLSDRSAEDLRHKARNMKFDYIKAGVVLPQGFHTVLLDKKFRDKLEAMGRPYEQEQVRQTKKQKKTAVPESQEEDESSHIEQQ